jgi:hypothetical protein
VALRDAHVQALDRRRQLLGESILHARQPLRRSALERRARLGEVSLASRESSLHLHGQFAALGRDALERGLDPFIQAVREHPLGAGGPLGEPCLDAVC